ncbi:hypothetical protein HYV81_01165 [Candidatus Woesearchaeota archaeon]|nr:hypothetical protein [Candidatus Woesearchaeota archaeon]
MRESLLLKVALATSLIGLMLLYFFAERIELDESTISKIDRTDIGNFVKVQGKVTKVYDNKDYTVLQIQQPETISVIFFSNATINEQDNVEIIGRVSEFKGKQQIVADRIRVIH